jgi:hypothetical protein
LERSFREWNFKYEIKRGPYIMGGIPLPPLDWQYMSPPFTDP